MTRILLHYILPLALPLALYLTYMYYRRSRAVAQGDDIPAIEKTHVFISIVLGFFLMAAGLIWFAVASGEPPGEGSYQSPRYEGGKIVPHEFK